MRKFLHNDSGASSAEFALLLVVFGLALMGGITVLRAAAGTALNGAQVAVATVDYGVAETGATSGGGGASAGGTTTTGGGTTTTGGGTTDGGTTGGGSTGGGSTGGGNGNGNGGANGCNGKKC